MAHILIIDDEADVRDSMQLILLAAGHSVRTAEHGPAGIVACREQPADVVITDIIMPKGHGFEAIEQIRSEFPACRIIAISGGGNFSPVAYEPHAITTTAYLAAALRFGAHAIMTKPFDSARLIETVDKVVAGTAT